MPSQHYMQIRVNFAHGGGAFPRPEGHVEVAPRHSAVVNFVRPPGARPTRFHGFQFARVWRPLPRPFFPPTFSLIRILPGRPSSCLPSQVVLVVAPCLIRGSLIRARGRAHRSVLLRLVKLTLNARPGLPLRFVSSSPFPRSISLSHACVAHAREKARVL